MKKLAMILLSCAMIFGMTGCSTEKTEEELQEEAYEKVEDAYTTALENGGVACHVYQEHDTPMNDDRLATCPVIYDEDWDATEEYENEVWRIYDRFALVTENGEEKLYYISYTLDLGYNGDDCYVYYYKTSEDKTLVNDMLAGVWYDIDNNVNWTATHIWWFDHEEVSEYDTGVDETYMVDELKSEMESYLESKGLTVDDIRYALEYVKANGL